MPRPCHFPAMPCRYGFRLCLSHLIYTVRPCLIHIHIPSRANTAPMPRPCHSTTMPFWKLPLKAMAQRDMGTTWTWHDTCELATAVQIRYVGDLRTFGLFWLQRRVPRRFFYQKHTNPLNCRTSSSDISGYHAEFNEGHGTVGEWQECGMSCELPRTAWQGNVMGTAWTRHGMCEWIDLYCATHRYAQCNDLLTVEQLVSSWFRSPIQEFLWPRILIMMFTLCISKHRIASQLGEIFLLFIISGNWKSSYVVNLVLNTL
jgi:hypothetical protein